MGIETNLVRALPLLVQEPRPTCVLKDAFVGKHGED